MKFIYKIIITFSVIAVSTFGQTVMTTAVDFTASDTKGNVHHLFNYLDKNKYVLLSITGTS